MTGLAEITIRKYEHNKFKPKYDTLQKIADALNIPVFDLLDKLPPDDEGLLDALLNPPELRYQEDPILRAFYNKVFNSPEEKQELYYYALSRLERLNVAGLSEANSHLDLLVKIKEYLDK